MLKPGASLASLSKLLLLSCIPQNAAVALSGGLGPLSPRGKHPPHKAPKSFVPTIHLWRLSEAYRSRSAFDVYIGRLIFLFFFFNNQGSRKCGELTAWQQQRNSLGKLRCSSLRFQPLRQASQRNNRLLVVFNLFFCGTFLVQETNLSVQRGGAWELNCQVVVLIRGLLQRHQTGLSNLSLTSTDRDMSLLLFKTLPTKNLFYKCNIVHKILLCKEKWQGAKFVNFA